MITVNKNVIVRHNPDSSALLYNPVTGLMTGVNPTGLFIWNSLLKNMNEPEIAKALCEACPDVPAEMIKHDVHQFLARCAAMDYIAGFAGDPVVVPETAETHPYDNQVLYTMNSMRRVFTPGDALVSKEIAFSEYITGDIVMFYPDGTQVNGIVHRVIAVEHDALVTMGDNNARPDRCRVMSKDKPRLVVAKIRPDGKRFEVKRGSAGMLQFRINRVRRFFHNAFYGVIRRLLPLMFWRKELKVCAGFDSVVQYAYKRRIYAKSTAGVVEFTPEWSMIFYKLPK